MTAGTYYFAKTWESGKSYLTERAKTVAKEEKRNPCDVLKEWEQDARSRKDTKYLKDIIQAQKFMGCKPSSKGRRLM